MSSRLSVCLLTRNEERNIGRAIGSVAGVADEVVVADTGSTDRTVEVARGLGARVVVVDWDDDFGAAQNLALGQATGDWVFWLNPDEELLPGGRDEVRTLLASGDDVFGYVVRVQDVTAADRPDLFSERWDLRLYRKRPDLTYVGRLHPAFTGELARAVAAEGKQVLASDLTVRRHAYLSALDGSKLRWAVRLLEKELQDRPGRLHYLIEYGRNLLLLHDPKGHEVMAEAVDKVAPHAEDPAPPSPDVQVLLEYVLTTPPSDYRGRITRDQASALALRWFASSPPLLWALAAPNFRAGRFRPAAVLLQQLVHLGRSGRYDRSQGFDPRIVGPWALLNLGQCHRALGETAEARKCFEELLQDKDFGPQAAKFLAELGGSAPPTPVP